MQVPLPAGPLLAFPEFPITAESLIDPSGKEGNSQRPKAVGAWQCRQPWIEIPAPTTAPKVIPSCGRKLGLNAEGRDHQTPSRQELLPSWAWKGERG